MDCPGRRRDRHRHRAGSRALAAAEAACLAARRRWLVGRRRGGTGPVAMGRVPVGPAGDEPGHRAHSALGRHRRAAVPDLPGGPGRQLPGLGADRLGRSQGARPARAAGQALAGRRARSQRRARAVRHAAPGGGGERARPDRGRRGDPGQCPARQESPRPAARGHRDRESRGRDREARGQGSQRRRLGAGPRHLAGELHRPRSRPVPGHLQHDRHRRRRYRAPGAGRCRAAEPGAQRGAAVAAGQRADGRLRQAQAGAVRRGHSVPRPAVQDHLAAVAAAGQLHAGAPGRRVQDRQDPARRRHLL